MALEKADRTEISKYVRDTVQRLPPRAMKAIGIGRLTGTPESDTPPTSDSSDRLSTTAFVWTLLTLGSYNVKDPSFAGGARGDGAYDDTAAIQAAINTAGVTKGTVFLPPGRYKITSPLVVPQEISIVGAGRFASYITQHTDNTQILQVTDGNSASVRISDLALTYANQQTAAPHPNSYAIAFMGSLEGGNVYYWTLERLQIAQATVGIGQLTSLSTYYFWGNHVAEIYMTQISKSLVDTTSTRFHGNPHNYFGKIVHLVASSPAPSGPALKLSGEFTLEGFDIEDWTNQLIWAEGNNLTTTPMPAAIRGVHVERHSITQASPLNIIDLENGKFVVEDIDYQTGIGTGTAFTHVLVNTNNADLNLSNVSVFDWGATGSLVIHGGSSTDSHVVSGIANHLDTGVSTGSVTKQVSLENGTVSTQNITATQTVTAQRLVPAVSALTYSATIPTDASLGDIFTLNVGNTAAFTISNPTNLQTGQTITYDILNGSGGVMGAITWGTNFRLAGAFTNPAANKRRTITFYANSGFMIEISRAAADI